MINLVIKRYKFALEKKHKIINRAFLLLIIAISGCTGTINNKPLSQNDITSVNGVNGVIYYPYALFYENSETTTRVDDKGKVIAWAVDYEPKKETQISTACKPVQLRKLTTRADYDNPRIIEYDHGFLEAYKFGLELNQDGTLKTVNTESTPDQGKTFANLASAAKDAGTLATTATKPALQTNVLPCNDGVALIGITRAR